jgi:glucose/arabinose dehydrogenase
VANEAQVFAKVDVLASNECGLLGIAVDPEFENNRFIYVYAIQPVEGETNVGKPRVIRYTDMNGAGTEPFVVVDDLPQTDPQLCAHVGGNLHFGPDGQLYLAVGNFELPDESKGVSNPLGKILRFSKADGSPAPDNPFVTDPAADNRVFAFGMRNPFDFAFDTETGKLYAVDNGPGTCDELNLIEAGADYGAPESLPGPDGPESCLGLGGRDPIHLFAKPGTKPEEPGSNVAPAGIAYLPAGLYPDLAAGLLVCEFNTGQLRHLELGGANGDQVTRTSVLRDDCAFNPEVGPDGMIFYSNGDGIFRIPAQSVVP